LCSPKLLSLHSLAKPAFMTFSIYFYYQFKVTAIKINE
jgi:hypothetical protein